MIDALNRRHVAQQPSSNSLNLCFSVFANFSQLLLSLLRPNYVLLPLQVYVLILSITKKSAMFLFNVFLPFCFLAPDTLIDSTLKHELSRTQQCYPGNLL